MIKQFLFLKCHDAIVVKIDFLRFLLDIFVTHFVTVCSSQGQSKTQSSTVNSSPKTCYTEDSSSRYPDY